MDGAVVHRVTNDHDVFRAAAADHELQVPPPKILEERGRGSLITNVEDQGNLLQFYAHSGRPMDIGVLIPTERLKIEYWMSIALQPVPGDEDPTAYLRVIQALWLERLRKVSKGLAQSIETLGDNFRYQIRCVFNGVRIWFVPTPTHEEAITRPFAEEPCPKDKWYSTTDLMAFTFPTLPDDQSKEVPHIIFGPNHSFAGTV
jgi:hypothetical protein